MEQKEIPKPMKCKEKKLYLDISNMREKFFNKRNHWDIRGSIERIERFIRTAQNSGWELKGFIDFCNVSTEVFATSQNRRIAEITREEKRFPAVLYQICEATFTRCGVEVHSNIEADCDDTLASWAQKDGASIYSADNDFFLYKNSNFTVYNDFVIKKEEIEFFCVNMPKIKEKPQRDIKDPPPKTVVFDKSHGYDLSYDAPTYKYGCSSALVKHFGNAYIHLRPLRQAIIFLLKGKPRLEVIPFWNSIIGSVEWDETKVEGSDEFVHLAKDRHLAMEEIFNIKELLDHDNKFDKINWMNHLFALYSLTFQLCSMVEENSDQKLIDWLLEEKKKIFGEEFEGNCEDCGHIFYSSNVFYKKCGLCKKKECDAFDSLNKRKFGGKPESNFCSSFWNNKKAKEKILKSDEQNFFNFRNKNR